MTDETPRSARPGDPPDPSWPGLPAPASTGSVTVLDVAMAGVMVDSPSGHARAVRAWTHEGDEMGVVRRAGDILILVRKRGPAFDAVIRALKAAGVPVAGADRLNIGEHIAVLDLVAVGGFAVGLRLAGHVHRLACVRIG